MAEESGMKVDGSIGKWRVMAKSLMVPLLRILALCATAAATLVMALNKETHTFAVATIGNTPVKVALTAKFQHTPANVLFVIANGVATLHSLLMIALSFVNHKYDFKGLRFVIVTVLDMMAIALVASAATTIAFMGELAKNGNSHARWNKICDNFDRYCNVSSYAMIVSYIGLLFLMIINIVSIFELGRLKNSKKSIIP